MKKNIFYILIAIIFFSPLYSMTASSANSQKNILTGVLIFKDKTENCLVANERCYKVDSSTEIFDSKGRKIGMESIPIPVRAAVSFIIEDSEERICLKIRIE